MFPSLRAIHLRQTRHRLRAARGPGIFFFGLAILAMLLPAVSHAAVSITTQPADTTVPAAQGASFAVSATGTGALTYQWQRVAAGGSLWSSLGDNPPDMVGTQTATLSFPSIPWGMNGDLFRVLVSDGQSTVASNPARLTVTSALIVSAHPQDASTAVGGTTSFSIVATAPGSIGYGWERLPAGSSTWVSVVSGAPYTGSVNAATLALNAIPAAMHGDQFRAVIFSSYGNKISNAATLTLTGVTLPPDSSPAIALAPAVQTLTMAGGRMAVTFVVSATGQPLSYQWRKDLVDIPGATGRSFVISEALPSDLGNYDVVVSNHLGSATSATVGFSLKASFVLANSSVTYTGASQGPTIVASPAAATFTPGGTFIAVMPGTYTATATATGSYTGSNNSLSWTIERANQATPTVTSAASFAFGAPYTATASSGVGSANWSLGAGSTALGVAINSSTGAVTTAGVGSVVIKVQYLGTTTHNSSPNSADFTITVTKAGQPAPAISSAASFPLGMGYTATANNGFGATSWALGDGSTAPGAAIDAATGAVSATGLGTVVVKARFAGDANYLASVDSADFAIVVAKSGQTAPVISSASTFLFGTSYTATANSGFGPLQWTLGSGSTATGAAIDATTGSVTATSAGTVVIKAHFAGDATHNASADSADFEITVAKLSQPEPVITSAPSSVLEYGYTATANTGFGPVKWILGTGSTAAGAAINANTGAVTCTGPGVVIIHAQFVGDAIHGASIYTAPFAITVTALSFVVIPSTFNWQAYLALNPDVAAAVGNNPAAPWDHYINYGIFEGRTDGDFDVRAYLAQYPDLAAQFGNNLKAAAVYWYTIGRQNGDRIPSGFSVAGYFLRNSDIAAAFANDKYGAWLHYYNYGIFEGRSYDANFIVEEYLELNPDLKAALGNNKQAGLMHWLTYGHPIEDRMGRVPIGFNVDSYLARYPDLQIVFGDITPTAVRNVIVWHHYIDYGTLEGRSDGDFEAYNYLATNPDLAAVFGTDIRSAALHWFFYGRREGRRIPEGFAVQDYRTRYPDIVVGLGDDLYGSWLHYRDTGVNEGRVFGTLFRPADYLALNPDVAAVIGNNYRDALLHWLYYGQYEGRSGKY